MRPVELKKWRQKLGLTQEEAGRCLGVSRVAFQNWETGSTPAPAMVDAACEREIQRWKRRLQYGPVALIYTDRPMWIGPSGHFGRMRREPFENNEAALQRVRRLWGNPDFHNPLIVDEAGSVWNLAQLEREIERRIGEEQMALKTPGLAEKLLDIGRRLSKLPVQDDRSADEILGYDEHGLPH